MRSSDILKGVLVAREKYTVLIKKPARKALDLIPEKIRKHINEKLKRLSNDPIGEAEGGPMSGYDNRFKFRQGGYRVIYEVFEEEVTVEVIKIGARGDVYKD